MSPFDALWHLLGLFLPALLTGALAAGAAKLLWRTELRGVRWTLLTLCSGTAGSLVLLGGLVAFGRDGRMLSYALMLPAVSLALWWAGFLRPQR
ncbi:MAG TPA: hypothetical protein PKB14_20065 [Rubrivivax sp.]|nr:hypothetical protein [Rubrivivax sp.]